MLVDHLEWYTVGEAPPRPLVTFLDRLSLELGKDFRDSFVEALTRSTVVVPMVSHAALQRMFAHDPSAVDNVLVEWLCALFLRNRNQLHSLLPVFVGGRGGGADGGSGALNTHDLGGNFFTHNSQPILSALPDMAPTATLDKAVELLQKTGMWPAHVTKVDPQLFGLPSFSVRAVVDKLSTSNGIFAANHTSMFDLLRKVGEAVHALVATAVGKSRPTTPVGPAGVSGLDAGAAALSSSNHSGGGGGGGGGGMMASPGSPMSPTLLALNQGILDPFDAAWAILHDPRFVADAPGLQAFLDDGYERDTMDVWTEEVVATVKSFLKGGGKLKFEALWKKALAAVT
jgi:hypothetical protein